jgi:hypothetical protein
MRLREIINQEAEVKDLDVLLEREFSIDERDITHVLEILKRSIKDAYGDNEEVYVKSHKIFAAYCSHQMRKAGVSEQTIGKYLEFSDFMARTDADFEERRAYSEKIVQEPGAEEAVKVLKDAKKKFIRELPGRYYELHRKDKARMCACAGWSHIMGSTMLEYNVLQGALERKKVR